jgi:hypothetical protein
MIAEIWSGPISAERRDTVTKQLQAHIQAKIQSTSACKGAYLLQRQLDGDRFEILILMLYEPRSGTENREASPLGDFADTLTCYEVVTDPARTLLYAELNRRFPLRMMAPR